MHVESKISHSENKSCFRSFRLYHFMIKRFFIRYLLINEFNALHSKLQNFVMKDDDF